MATLFSSFTTPLLASLFSAGIYVAGHLTRDLRALGAQTEAPGLEAVTVFLHRILPDLEAFNRTLDAVHGLPIPPAEVAHVLLYGALYSAAILCLASVVFRRRDFR